MFVHPQAIVESKQVGEGTRIWAFAHVLPGAVIGRDCNICDQTFIENDVKIGDRVTVKCGVQIWDGTRIEDDVFLGPNATLTNDKFPRSRQRPDSFPRLLIKKGASIGANATILPGLTIGQEAMVGAGAVVTRDVPAYAIVCGNPARITGYVNALLPGKQNELRSNAAGEVQVRGVKLLRSSVVQDMRGSLVFRQLDKGLPFIPRRVFMVFDVPSKDVRGEHAHKKLEQLLVCAAGSVSVMLDDGKCRQEFLLDSPELALYIPPMVWGVQYRYSADARLLVLASMEYDAADYIRDYDEFLRGVAAR